jgi:hypothetical protein
LGKLWYGDSLFAFAKWHPARLIRPSAMRLRDGVLVGKGILRALFERTNSVSVQPAYFLALFYNSLNAFKFMPLFFLFPTLTADHFEVGALKATPNA